MNSHLRIVVPMFVAAAVVPASPAVAHEGWGIVVHATGWVYVADIPANIIWRISREGKVERVALGKHSHALVLDSAGNIYGTNPHLTLSIRSVWRLNLDGQLTDIISPTENCPLGLQSFIMDGAPNMYSVNARNAQTPELLLLQRGPTAGSPRWPAARSDIRTASARRHNSWESTGWRGDPMARCT